MGIVFQRALLITTAIAAILVLPLWLNVGGILTKFGELISVCALQTCHICSEAQVLADVPDSH